ncbi:MAG: hypothetical protein Q9188_006532 [Gyalolechia gomerana]
MPHSPTARVRRWLLLLFLSLITILFTYKSILSQLHLRGHGKTLRQDSAYYHAKHLERRDAIPLGPVDQPLNLTNLRQDSPLVIRATLVNYQDYVCKGERALGMIINNPSSTHEWTKQDIDGAWEIQPGGSRTPLDLEAPLNSLRIPHTANDVKVWYADQNKPFTDQRGRPNNRPTNGYYYNAFIPDALRGTIIADQNYSPRSQVEMSNREVPPLNRWSDIVWILWTRVAGDQASKLRFVFRAGVVNDISRAIIDRATRSRDGEFRSPWPGRTFDMRTDDGKALLGTPHGIGIAYLIADHSDVLGRKIPFARVFTADDYQDRRRQVSEVGSDVYTYPYYLLWELRDTATGDRPLTLSTS